MPRSCWMSQQQQNQVETGGVNGPHQNRQSTRPSRVGLESPFQPIPGKFRELEGGHVAVHHRMKRLKGALGWSLAGIILSYALVVSAAGAIAR